jgi:hypothetical protein
MVENAYKVTLAGAFVPLFFGALLVAPPRRERWRPSVAASAPGCSSNC